MYLDSWLDGFNKARDKEEQDKKKNPNFNPCVFATKNGALQDLHFFSPILSWNVSIS